MRYLLLFGPAGFCTLILRLLRAKWRSWWHRYTAMYYPITPSDMADFCAIPIRRVKERSAEELAEELRNDGIDLIVSVSYNWIFSQKLIDAVPMGILNTHNAPLPNYRGLMPAFWQLLHGETESAATVHRVVKEIDAGEILGRVTVPIKPDDSWEALVIRSKKLSGWLLADVVEEFETCAEEGRQPLSETNPVGEGSYFSFPSAADGRTFRRHRKFWGL